MRTLPISRMLGLSAMTLAAMIIANGCQSTQLPPYGSESVPSASRQLTAAGMVFETGNPKYILLRPGMEIEWALNTPSADQPWLVRHGKAVVGPDGGLVLGPYGTTRVAGLTFEQATRQMERQLASYVKQPRITLATVVPSPVFSEIAWKNANAPSPYVIANDQRNPSFKEDPIRPVGFQPSELASNVPPEHPEAAFMLLGQPQRVKLGHSRNAPLPLPDGPNEMNPVLLPEYVIRPPDVLLIESLKGLLTQPIRGQHLVRPDGSVFLGIHGSAVVAGKTLTQAREEVARAIYSKLAQGPQPNPKYPDDKTKLIYPPTYKDVVDNLSIDVLAYNSQVYYVITDGAGLGEQVYKFPLTGSENVLDAISNINGLPIMSSPRRIWVARRNPGFGGPESIYPVDWRGITRMGAMNTNWQLMPGDRVYVQADQMRLFNNTLSKFLEPVERVLGVTLLGAQTVNAIKGNVGNNTNR